MKLAVSQTIKEEIEKSIREGSIEIVTTKDDYDFVCLEKAVFLGDSIVLKGKDKYHVREIEEIIYFRMNGSSLYCNDGIDEYELDLKLYQVEQQFKHKNFMRVSKSDVVNLRKIRDIAVLPFSRYELLMEDGEKIFVTRTYHSIFKSRFGL